MLTQFQLQSSDLIQAPGKVIPSSVYHYNVYWLPVKVSCTVLTGLVINRIYLDPCTGKNNILIPDASDEFNKTYNPMQ